MTLIKSYQKLISLLTLCFFIPSFLPAEGLLYALENLSPPAGLSVPFVPLGIPPELASIEEVYLPETGSGKQEGILHLQTAHSHPEAQRKIYQLLKFLDEKYGLARLFIEGAGEKLNPDYFQFFDDKRLNFQVGEKLIEKGELTGAELFLIESEKRIPAYGIESPDLYRENLTSFQSVMSRRSVTGEFTRKLHRTLDRLETRLLRPDARKLLQINESFEAGNLELLSYLLELERNAQSSLNLDLRNYQNQLEWPQLIRILRLQEIESRLDPEKIQVDRQKLIDSLKEMNIEEPLLAGFQNLSFSPFRSGMVYDPGIRKNDLPRYLAERLTAAAEGKGFSFNAYPYFARFLEAAVLQSELDGERLFEETDKLFDTLVRSLSVEEKEWALTSHVKMEGVLGRLFDLELTPKDYSKVLLFNQASRPLVRYLLNIENLQRESFPETVKLVPENIQEIESLYGDAFQFYEMAKKRETVMVGKVLDPAHRNDGRASGLTVLITGGFHAEGLGQAFRKKQIPYTLVSPRITEKSLAESYVSSLLGDKKTVFDSAHLEPAIKLMSAQIREQMTSKKIMGAEIRLNLESVFEIARDAGISAEKVVYEINKNKYSNNRKFQLRFDDTKTSVYILDRSNPKQPVPLTNLRGEVISVPVSVQTKETPVFDLRSVRPTGEKLRAFKKQVSAPSSSAVPDISQSQTTTSLLPASEISQTRRRPSQAPLSLESRREINANGAASSSIARDTFLREERLEPKPIKHLPQPTSQSPFPLDSGGNIKNAKANPAKSPATNAILTKILNWRKNPPATAAGTDSFQVSNNVRAAISRRSVEKISFMSSVPYALGSLSLISFFVNKYYSKNQSTRPELSASVLDLSKAEWSRRSEVPSRPTDAGTPPRAEVRTVEEPVEKSLEELRSELLEIQGAVQKQTGTFWDPLAPLFTAVTGVATLVLASISLRSLSDGLVFLTAWLVSSLTIYSFKIQGEFNRQTEKYMQHWDRLAQISKFIHERIQRAKDSGQLEFSKIRSDVHFGFEVISQFASDVDNEESRIQEKEEFVKKIEKALPIIARPPPAPGILNLASFDAHARKELEFYVARLNVAVRALEALEASDPQRKIFLNSLIFQDLPAFEKAADAILAAEFSGKRNERIAQILNKLGAQPEILKDPEQRRKIIQEHNASAGGAREILTGRSEAEVKAAPGLIPMYSTKEEEIDFLRRTARGEEVTVVFAGGRATRMRLPASFDRLGIAGLTPRILKMLPTDESVFPDVDAGLWSAIYRASLGGIENTEDLSFIQRALLQFRLQLGQLVESNPESGLSLEQVLKGTRFAVIVNEDNLLAIARQLAAIKFAGLLPEHVTPVVQLELGGEEVLKDGSTRPYTREHWPEGPAIPLISMVEEASKSYSFTSSGELVRLRTPLVDTLQKSGARRMLITQTNDLNLLRDIVGMERRQAAIDAMHERGAEMAFEVVENTTRQSAGAIFTRPDGFHVVKHPMALQAHDLRKFSVPELANRMFSIVDLEALKLLQKVSLPEYLIERKTRGGENVLTREIHSDDLTGVLKAWAIRQPGYRLETFKSRSRIPFALSAFQEQDNQPGFQELIFSRSEARHVPTTPAAQSHWDSARSEARSETNLKIEKALNQQGFLNVKTALTGGSGSRTFSATDPKGSPVFIKVAIREDLNRHVGLNNVFLVGHSFDFIPGFYRTGQVVVRSLGERLNYEVWEHLSKTQFQPANLAGKIFHNQGPLVLAKALKKLYSDVGSFETYAAQKGFPDRVYFDFRLHNIMVKKDTGDLMLVDFDLKDGAADWRNVNFADTIFEMMRKTQNPSALKWIQETRKEWREIRKQSSDKSWQWIGKKLDEMIQPSFWTSSSRSEAPSRPTDARTPPSSETPPRAEARSEAQPEKKKELIPRWALEALGVTPQDFRNHLATHDPRELVDQLKVYLTKNPERVQDASDYLADKFPVSQKEKIETLPALEEVRNLAAAEPSRAFARLLFEATLDPSLAQLSTKFSGRRHFLKVTSALAAKAALGPLSGPAAEWTYQKLVRSGWNPWYQFIEQFSKNPETFRFLQNTAERLHFLKGLNAPSVMLRNELDLISTKLKQTDEVELPPLSEDQVRMGLDKVVDILQQVPLTGEEAELQSLLLKDPVLYQNISVFRGTGLRGYNLTLEELTKMTETAFDKIPRILEQKIKVTLSWYQNYFFGRTGDQELDYLLSMENNAKMLADLIHQSRPDIRARLESFPETQDFLRSWQSYSKNVIEKRNKLKEKREKVKQIKAQGEEISNQLKSLRETKEEILENYRLRSQWMPPTYSALRGTSQGMEEETLREIEFIDQQIRRLRIQLKPLQAQFKSAKAEFADLKASRSEARSTPQREALRRSGPSAFNLSKAEPRRRSEARKETEDRSQKLEVRDWKEKNSVEPSLTSGVEKRNTELKLNHGEGAVTSNAYRGDAWTYVLPSTKNMKKQLLNPHKLSTMDQMSWPALSFLIDSHDYPHKGAINNKPHREGNQGSAIKTLKGKKSAQDQSSQDHRGGIRRQTIQGLKLPSAQIFHGGSVLQYSKIVNKNISNKQYSRSEAPSARPAEDSSALTPVGRKSEVRATEDDWSVKHVLVNRGDQAELAPGAFSGQPAALIFLVPRAGSKRDPENLKFFLEWNWGDPYVTLQEEGKAPKRIFSERNVHRYFSIELPPDKLIIKRIIGKGPESGPMLIMTPGKVIKRSPLLARIGAEYQKAVFLWKKILDTDPTDDPKEVRKYAREIMEIRERIENLLEPSLLSHTRDRAQIEAMIWGMVDLVDVTRRILEDLDLGEEPRLEARSETSLQELMKAALSKEFSDWEVDLKMAMAETASFSVSPFEVLISFDGEKDITGIALGKAGEKATYAVMIEQGGKHAEVGPLTENGIFQIKLFEKAGGRLLDHFVLKEANGRYLFDILLQGGLPAASALGSLAQNVFETAKTGSVENIHAVALPLDQWSISPAGAVETPANEIGNALKTYEKKIRESAWNMSLGFQSRNENLITAYYELMQSLMKALDPQEKTTFVAPFLGVDGILPAVRRTYPVNRDPGDFPAAIKLVGDLFPAGAEKARTNLLNPQPLDAWKPESFDFLRIAGREPVTFVLKGFLRWYSGEDSTTDTIHKFSRDILPLLTHSEDRILVLDKEDLKIETILGPAGFRLKTSDTLEYTTQELLVIVGEKNLQIPNAVAIYEKPRREVRSQLSMSKFERDIELDLPVHHLVDAYRGVLRSSHNDYQSSVDMQLPQPGDSMVIFDNGRLEINRRLKENKPTLFSQRNVDLGITGQIMKDRRVASIEINYGESKTNLFGDPGFLRGLLRDILMDLHDHKSLRTLGGRYGATPSLSSSVHPRSRLSHALDTVQRSPRPPYRLRFVLGPFSGMFIEPAASFNSFLRTLEKRSLRRQEALQHAKFPSRDAIEYPFYRLLNPADDRSAEGTLKMAQSNDALVVMESFEGNAPVELTFTLRNVSIKRGEEELATLPLANPVSAVGYWNVSDLFYFFLDERDMHNVESHLREHGIRLQAVGFQPARSETRALPSLAGIDEQTFFDETIGLSPADSPLRQRVNGVRFNPQKTDDNLVGTYLGANGQLVTAKIGARTDETEFRIRQDPDFPEKIVAFQSEPPLGRDIDTEILRVFLLFLIKRGFKEVRLNLVMTPSRNFFKGILPAWEDRPSLTDQGSTMWIDLEALDANKMRLEARAENPWQANFDAVLEALREAAQAPSNPLSELSNQALVWNANLDDASAMAEYKEAVKAYSNGKYQGRSPAELSVQNSNDLINNLITPPTGYLQMSKMPGYESFFTDKIRAEFSRNLRFVMASRYLINRVTEEKSSGTETLRPLFETESPSRAKAPTPDSDFAAAIQNLTMPQDAKIVRLLQEIFRQEIPRKEMTIEKVPTLSMDAASLRLSAARLESDEAKTRLEMLARLIETMDPKNVRSAIPQVLLDMSSKEALLAILKELFRSLPSGKLANKELVQLFRIWGTETGGNKLSPLILEGQTLRLRAEIRSDAVKAFQSEVAPKLLPDLKEIFSDRPQTDPAVSILTAIQLFLNHEGKPNPILDITFLENRHVAEAMMTALLKALNDNLSDASRVEDVMKEVFARNQASGAFMNKGVNVPGAHAVIWNQAPSPGELRALLLPAILNKNLYMEVLMTPDAKIDAAELRALEQEISRLLSDGAARVALLRHETPKKFEESIRRTSRRLYSKMESRILLPSFEAFRKENVVVSISETLWRQSKALQQAVGNDTQSMLFAFDPADSNYLSYLGASSLIGAKLAQNLLSRDQKAPFADPNRPGNYRVNESVLGELIRTFEAAMAGMEKIFASA